MDTRIVVVGGGIAGASAAAFLALRDGVTVTLVEQESMLAHHTTGRSAAQWIENLGHPAIRPLTTASRGFFDHPTEGSSDGPLLTSRPVLMVGRRDQAEIFHRVLATGRATSPPARELTPAEAGRLCPVVDPSQTAFAMIEDGASDIDVAGTHQAFVRILRRHGGTIATSTRVDAARPDGDSWTVETTSGRLPADVLVNASGAWGDVVAEAAGIEPVGLQPRRRTAFMVPLSALPDTDRTDAHDWPMLVNVDHDWYVKPDGAQFLCSPADQTPSAPVDARAEELDVALAIGRINAETRLRITSVASVWAGLRTFAPDESMVIGRDPANRSFVWCVGQGGTGIQTAPAAGRLTAALALGDDDGIMSTSGLDLATLSAQRFR